jgi:radical SAM superfamily enzyme YgiQ (UPF0313 family)
LHVTGGRSAAAPASGLDLLFVVPPGGQTASFPEHLGVAFLRAMLAREGVRAEQLLPPRNLSAHGLAAILEARRPPIVGVTVYESNLRACRAVTAVVRRCLPETVVVAGGPNATFSPEETLELVDGDVALRGAGEARIAPLARAILGAERARRRLPELLARLPGLVLRTPAGVHHTPGCDLSSFPAGPFSCLDDLPSPYQLGLVASPEVGLLTARGCNQHCTYCSFAEISGRRVHYHGVERVLEDLAALERQLERGAWRRDHRVPVNDDAFTLAPQRAREICEGIIRRGLQRPMTCQTRADRVDPELLRLMKAAGFDGVSFGLESAVPRVLRAIGKLQAPDTTRDPGFEVERQFVEQVRQAVAAARAAGLAPSVSVIGGLPTETADDFRATLAFVDSLRVPVYAHNVLFLLPGTPAYRDRAQLGLEAGRQAASGSWVTRHAFDVGSVRSLACSTERASLRQEAEELTDALCGRPRLDRADDDSAWAVVIHADEPEAEVLAWLPEVTAWHAAVVVVRQASSPDVDGQAWLQALLRARVAWGSFALLVRQDRGEGAFELRARATLGEHRFRVDGRWGATGRAIAEDEQGNHAVSIWLASAAEAPPPARSGDGLPTAGPQLADSCRWWSGWRRCLRPRTLHVWPDRTVTPCWGGPAIGRVGDAYGALQARGQALGATAEGARAARCPMGSEGPTDAEALAGVERHEVAAQLAWVWRLGSVVRSAGPPREETR